MDYVACLEATRLRGPFCLDGNKVSQESKPKLDTCHHTIDAFI